MWSFIITVAAITLAMLCCKAITVVAVKLKDKSCEVYYKHRSVLRYYVVVASAQNLMTLSGNSELKQSILPATVYVFSCSVPGFVDFREDSRVSVIELNRCKHLMKAIEAIRSHYIETYEVEAEDLRMYYAGDTIEDAMLLQQDLISMQPPVFVL